MALRRDAIGLREVLFQSVSFTAPAGSVAFSLILGAKYAGGALCLSVLLALIPCLSVAVSLGLMARHIPSAGAFFVYPARAIHPIVGFLVAWGYIFVIGTAAGSIAVLIGMQIRGALGPAEGAPSMLLWISSAIVPLVIVFALSLRGIRASAGAGTIIGLGELIVICTIAIGLIVTSWSELSIEPFTTGAARVHGFEGWSGIIAGAVYATLAFSGFESSLPLAEEARNARTTMIRAMVLTCLLAAGIFILTSYAATIAIGGDAFAAFTLTDEGTPWVPLAGSVWRPLSTVLVVALLSSLFAGQNAAFNTLTRTWFSMGRSGVLPSALARTGSFGAPYVAATVQLVISLGVAAVGSVVGIDTIFLGVGTAGTVLLILVYMAANVSCIVFFLRERRAEVRPWLHVGVPLVGIVAFVPVLCAALGIGSSILPFVEPLQGPAVLAGPLIGIWMGIGLAIVIALAKWRPAKLAAAGAVLAGEE